jgi:hypothetical protein
VGNKDCEEVCGILGEEISGQRTLVGMRRNLVTCSITILLYCDFGLLNFDDPLTFAIFLPTQYY